MYKLEEKKEVRKPSTSQVLVNASEKLGKVVTEFFTGKPLTEAQKEEQRLEREHKAKLRHIQNEARRKRELEAAERGEYVEPQKKVDKKDPVVEMFLNIGKHNPVGDFGDKKSLGTNTFGVEKYSKMK